MSDGPGAEPAPNYFLLSLGAAPGLVSYDFLISSNDDVQALLDAKALSGIIPNSRYVGKATP